MTTLICYCYGYTEKDIEADLVRNNGRSSLAEKIMFNRENSLCQCDLKHPEKR